MSKQVVGETQAIAMDWKGWFGKGKVGYNRTTALKELLNNLVQKNKLVNAQVVIDTETGMFYITDDMCGVESDLLNGIFFGGKSYPNGALLSEHGEGLTISTNWWGMLQYVRTSIDGNDFDEVRLDRTQQVASVKTIYNVEPIQKYSIDNKEWVDTDTPGFQLKIKLHKTPKNTLPFDNLIHDINAAYWNYLGKYLNVDIIWLKKGKFHKHYVAQKPEMILSQNVSHGTIDKNRKLGNNDWDIDEIYKCKKTGKIVELKIGTTADPVFVKDHYGEDVYNRYIESPYCRNGSMIGIHYCKAWVPIGESQFNPTSRGESLIGFINILDGIDTVQTKDDIVRSADGDIEEFEDELKEYLKSKDVYVRVTRYHHKISEKQMERDILKRLKTSPEVRKVMGFTDNNDFDNVNITIGGGVPDISCYVDNKKNTHCAVIEMKKESGDRLWEAITQGYAYALGTNCKRAIIVAQGDDLTKRMWDKIRLISSATGVQIEYHNYQYLMGL